MQDASENEKTFSPTITFDTKEKSFEFVYDPLSAYLNYGTYSIEEDKVIATTSDGKYTYTFKIIDDTIISFMEEESDTVETIDGVIAVQDKARFELPYDDR